MYDVITLIKQAALDAVAAEKPLALVFGLVTVQEDIPEGIPLEITLEQKAVIGREFDSGSGNWYFNPNSQILSDIAALGASKNASSP